MRLNLGAGDWNPPGYTSVDLWDADVKHDLSVFPWPFADGSVEEILASHVLEHFTRAQAWDFLRECKRILKPGDGILHIAVPDLDKFIDCRISGDYSPLNGYYWTSLDSLMGGGDQEPNVYQRHRYMWCAASLLYTLEGLGFRAYVTVHAPPHNPRYEAISLRVAAYPLTGDES